MTYQKPPKIKYTDMSIYIDTHIYQEDCDESLCFQYLYHLSYMLARKRKLFPNTKDLDDFAIYAATCLYLRYKKKNRPPIKSVLNYTKKSVYGLSVNFKQKQYKEFINEHSADEDSLNNLQNTFTNRAINSNQDILRVEINEYFTYAIRTLNTILRDYPYTSKLDKHNIYLSVLLTFISNTTLSRENKKRLENSKNNVEDLYIREQEEVILFHLPSHMRNYIQIIARRFKHQMGKDIAYLVGAHKPSPDIIQDILKSPLGEGDNNLND